MNCVGRFSADLGRSKSFCFFFNASRVLACRAKPGQNGSTHKFLPKLSPNHAPKKFLEKIFISFIRCMCMKAKEEDGVSSKNSKKFMEKIRNTKPFVSASIKKNQEDDNCLWKKTILMGERCQPLEFPGSIFYDSEGNQISEPPRTPRNSDLSFRGFARKSEYMEM
ncbi:unnamed protein product [Lupinus luteus]|uniref:Uncharacterized protein n=1 Tax=Lupinus luteus TaxID=3873 RepID=A0AAV1VRU4_LUPLU